MNKRLLVFKRFMEILGQKLANFWRPIFKAAFSKKTILFVSQKKIRSYSVSPAAQIGIAIFVCWLVNIFIQSVRYDSVIEKKSSEISQLKKSNSQFEKEVDSLNSNLEKINDYFNSVSKYSNASSEDSFQEEIDKSAPIKFKSIFGDMQLSKKDHKIAVKIANSNAMLDNIKGQAKRRVIDLQKKIAITGLTLAGNHVVFNRPSYRNENIDRPTEISLNDTSLNNRQGGPFYKSGRKYSENTEEIEVSGGTVDVNDEITYLTKLEKFIRFAPLFKPMDNYYVSSGFGERNDPIRGVRAVHNGMDFVGKDGEKILSPSIGRVIFAGKFGAYGTGLVIDHGYGITSRYGHLSKIKVKEGDLVKKGDIIAIQGNTGRSTGSHLHYEVRYKNTPLNPKKFLQAGQAIFNDENTINHVDS